MSDNLPEKRGVNMEEIARMAKMTSDAGFAQSAGAAGVQLATAASLGLSPMAGLFNVHVVKGKPSLSSKLLLGLLNNAPDVDYEFTENTETTCTIVIHRNSKRLGGWNEAGRVTYTLEDAKKAGLTKNPTWVSHPKLMLAYRATSQAVSLYCPEIALDIPVGDPEYADMAPPRATVGKAEMLEVPEAEFSVTVDHMHDDTPVFTGEVVDEAEVEDVPSAAAMMKPITQKQRARLWAIAKKSLGEDAEDVVRRVVKWLSKQESTNDIPVAAYDSIIAVIETWPEMAEQLSAHENAEGGEE